MPTKVRHREEPPTMNVDHQMSFIRPRLRHTYLWTTLLCKGRSCVHTWLAAAGPGLFATDSVCHCIRSSTVSTISSTPRRHSHQAAGVDHVEYVYPACVSACAIGRAGKREDKFQLQGNIILFLSWTISCRTACTVKRTRSYWIGVHIYAHTILPCWRQMHRWCLKVRGGPS